MAHLPAPPLAHNDTILIGGERHKTGKIIRKPGSGIIGYRVARG